MIDYKKLQEAMELATKINCYLSIELVHAHDSCGTSRVTIRFRESGSLNQSFDSIDDLIEKLNELTKPEPKYKKSQLVWFIEDIYRIESKVVMDICTVKDFDTGEDEYAYEVSMDFPICESSLFPTRQALIEHQIAYWIDELKSLPEYLQLTGKCSPDCDKNCESDTQTNQPKVDVDRCPYDPEGCPRCVPCNHEPDFTWLDDGWKCIKCGELYR